MPKIGLVGPMRSGKSTAATHLQRTQGYHRYAFGDCVKEAVAGMMTALDAYIYDGDVSKEWTPESIHDYKTHPAIRSLLHLAGDELGPNLVGGPFVWIDKLEEKLDADHHPNIVVDDVRYINEAAALKSRGFVLIRIDRNEKERQHELISVYGVREAKKLNEHPSEREMIKIKVDHALYAESAAYMKAEIGDYVKTLT